MHDPDGGPLGHQRLFSGRDLNIISRGKGMIVLRDGLAVHAHALQLEPFFDARFWDAGEMFEQKGQEFAGCFDVKRMNGDD